MIKVLTLLTVEFKVQECYGTVTDPSQGPVADPSQGAWRCAYRRVLSLTFF